MASTSAPDAPTLSLDMFDGAWKVVVFGPETRAMVITHFEDDVVALDVGVSDIDEMIDQLNQAKAVIEGQG